MIWRNGRVHTRGQLVVRLVLIAAVRVARERRVDLSLGLEALEGGALRLHVERVVDVVVQAELLVGDGGALAHRALEVGRFVFVEVSYMVVYDGEFCLYVIGS